MKVVILSCANTGNFGDDIILEGIKIKLFREYPNVGGTIHQILRINEGTIDFVNSCDALIIGGGEILSHSDVLEQVTKFDIKIPYLFLSVGIGDERDIVPFLSKLRPVSWSGRTIMDVDILHKCGIKNADICPDPIFECPIDRTPNGKIGVNLKNLHKDHIFINNMAVAFDTLIDMGVKFDFLSLNSISRQAIEYCGEKMIISDCTGDELMKQIQPLMKNEINIVSYKENPLEFLNSLAGYEAIVGERLHSLMAAYHAGIDFRAVAYHEKIDKFLDMFGIENKKINHDPVAIGCAIGNLWKEYV